VNTNSSLVRFLLVEAAQVTVRSLPEWRSQYFRLLMRRGRKTAKVAMARRLAIRLYWMWREGRDYQQWRSSVRTQDSPEIAMVCSQTPSN
jgi:transposase